MSDNKTFDLWKLYGLIGKLESGEIKTWIQLALDLGVDSPGPGQSAQKVQQYAVRLKVSFFHHGCCFNLKWALEEPCIVVEPEELLLCIAAMPSPWILHAHHC
ncbi:ARS binding protein 2-domain-containing protein [Phyllosticta citribraziliensis]